MYDFMKVIFIYSGSILFFLFLSNIFVKPISLHDIKEIIDEEEKMILLHKINNFQYKYDEPFEKLEICKLDDDYKKTLKHKIIKHNVPNNCIKMFYDYENDCFSYYTRNRDIPFKYLDTICKKYCIDFNCKELFKNNIDETKIDDKINDNQINSCFKNIKVYKKIEKIKNHYKHLGKIPKINTKIYNNFTFLDFLKN